MSDSEHYYRIEDYRTAPPLNEFDEPCGPSGEHLRLMIFDVVKHTPKGVQIKTWMGNLRLILHSSHKRYACPTLEEAKESFRRRKVCQISILQRQLSIAQNAQSMVGAYQLINGHYIFTNHPIK